MRRNAIGVGVVLGISLTISFLVAGRYSADLLNCLVKQTCQGFALKYNESEPLWWQNARLLVSAEDSLAQWLMVLLSFVAALLLWRTLKKSTEASIAATKSADAALEANNILRAEQRPWISLSQRIPCHFLLSPNETACDFAWELYYENKGRTPAHNVRMVSDVYRYDWQYVGAGREGVLDVVRRAKSSTSLTARVLFPNEVRTAFIWGRSIIGGAPKGTFFLCCCVIYDLDPIGSEQGYDAKAFVLENREGQFGPFAHKILNVTGYNEIA